MKAITPIARCLWICCVLIVPLAGCARGVAVPAATASPIASRKLPLIGVSLPDVASTDVTLIQKGLADNQRKNDVSLLYRSADGKAEKQVSDIAGLVRLDIVGLIVLPVDAAVIAPAIEAARQKGIPVLAIDTPPTGGMIDSLVRPDYRANGREAAKYSTETSTAKGATLILAANDARGEDFTAGAQEGLAKATAPVQTIAIGDTTEIAGVVLAAVRDRNVRTILAGDDTLALAAAGALKGAGLLTGVEIVGHGGTRDAIRAVLEGTLAGDVDLRLQDLGVAAVGGIAALARKKQPSSDVIVRIDGVDVPVNAVAGRLINRDNARDMQERWPDLMYAAAVTPTPTHTP